MILAELKNAMERERAWDRLCRTGGMDSGSYCESAANDFVSSAKIRRLYRELVDAIQSHDRLHYKFPEDQE